MIKALLSNYRHVILSCLFSMSLSVPAMAQTPDMPADHTASRLCREATAQVERALRLPDGFLAAISRVETGRPDENGTLLPWPWSINAAGKGYYYATRQEAIDAVRAFQQQGVTSIDVGCMQVNLLHHPTAFPSLDSAFDPYSNARYAGMFLQKMKEQTGSWPRAAAAYHSQTASNGTAYLQQVLQQWATPQDAHSDHSPALPMPPHGITGRTVPPARTTAPHAPMPYRPFIIRPATSAPSGAGINHAETGSAAFLAALHHQETSTVRQPVPTTPSAQAGNSPYNHRQFRPFRGMFRPVLPPPPHQRMKSTQNGRSLAAYRAMPVHTIQTMPYAPAY